MTKWMIGLALAASMMSGSAMAQLAPVNEMGVTNGHYHMNSKDIEANKKILTAMGGVAMKNGNFEIIKFPGVFVFLNQANAPQATAGSVGSVVNHYGFLVPNVQEAMAKWKAAGVPVVPGGNGRLDQAFVTTPDGMRIEILEDKAQKEPIKNHHVHFALPESEIPKARDWYSKTFGGKPGMRGANVAADLPGVNLSFSKSDTGAALPTTKGRVLDHIGFDIKNLQAFCNKLAADGVKVDRPYVKNPNGVALCFVYDPWGTYIELNERDTPL